MQIPVNSRRLFVLRLLFCGLALLFGTACANGGGGGHAQSSGTPVNPFADPGGADTRTAPLTGAQPRRY